MSESSSDSCVVQIFEAVFIIVIDSHFSGPGRAIGSLCVYVCFYVGSDNNF